MGEVGLRYLGKKEYYTFRLSDDIEVSLSFDNGVLTHIGIDKMFSFSFSANTATSETMESEMANSLIDTLLDWLEKVVSSRTEGVRSHTTEEREEWW